MYITLFALCKHFIFFMCDFSEHCYLNNQKFIVESIETEDCLLMNKGT